MGSNLYYLFVIIGTAIFSLAIVYVLRTPFFNLSTSAVKQLDIILNASLGEKEKDRLILKNLLNLLLSFFKTLFLFLLIIIVGSIPAILFLEMNPTYAADTSSFYFYLSMLIGSCVLFVIVKKDSGYSYWSKLLHTILLDNYHIGKFLFKKEVKKFNKNKLDNEEELFVIVTGLARSGTTALTNTLFNSNAFYSINYSNMPFLMAPNTWKKIYNPKGNVKKERAHGDKVLVGEKSIEALEEYFFKAMDNDEYIQEASLGLQSIDEKLYRSYISYQRLFAENQENKFYLAKNNNFILRYHSMREHNQQFKLVSIFRDPIEHAQSLMDQNKNFLAQQSEDPFVLDYMNWLGHYEFGINLKVFEFGNDKTWLKYDKNSLNFWLAIWLNYYQYILQFLNEKNCFLIHYLDFLESPKELMNSLKSVLQIDFEIENQERFIPKKKSRKDQEMLDSDLLDKVNQLYKSLLEAKIEPQK